LVTIVGAEAMPARAEVVTGATEIVQFASWPC
jgi:hypothetical protein